MVNNDANSNWRKIINKFNTHEGTIVEFCKQNQINVHQLYYYRKKFKKENKATFHCINITKENTSESVAKNIILNPITDIKIEIGKANIYIKSNDQVALSNIIRELTKSC